MSRVFFRKELETVATYWRVFRQDGVALAFTSHNRDLHFDGIRHRAAPGMLPSSIRKTAELSREQIEVQGILSHDAITSADLRAGRYDGAQIVIGVVDWENLERLALFHGRIGSITEEAEQFEAELLSAKADLEIDLVPRTSPTCRARFCDADCGLNSAAFTHLATVQSVDIALGKVLFDTGPAPSTMLSGSIRWIDGPQAGVEMRVQDADASGMTLDRPLEEGLLPGHRALLREGCDHSLATCHGRFANSANFRGEPYLPGNDLLTRYGSGSA